MKMIRRTIVKAIVNCLLGSSGVLNACPYVIFNDTANTVIASPTKEGDIVIVGGQRKVVEAIKTDGMDTGSIEKQPIKLHQRKGAEKRVFMMLTELKCGKDGEKDIVTVSELRDTQNMQSKRYIGRFLVERIDNRVNNDRYNHY